IGLILKLHDEKKISTIVVTHQIADAIAMADRFVVLVKGEVAFDGTLDELRDCSERRVRAFLNPFRASFEEVARRKFVTM
ncbi:MAG: ABC transporter ATP-binding protein, partial [Candidatus Zixiibacteriota bacterium]